MSSAATKREAKSYLSRFGSKIPSADPPNTKIVIGKGTGVNLGQLYPSIRDVKDSLRAVPKAPTESIQGVTQPLHIALVKVRGAQTIDDVTLHGVGHTLSQLTRLGLSCVVVADYNDSQGLSVPEKKRLALEQADRLVTAIDSYGGSGARRLDNVIGVGPDEERDHLGIQGEVQVTNRNILLAPLRRGMVPVVASIGFLSTTQSMAAIDANKVVMALTREFAGVQSRASLEDNPLKVAERVKELQKQISLDRVILLDPLGGIPSSSSTKGSHVFINLEQEYDLIRNELSQADPYVGESSDKIEDTHLQNLELLRQTLALLPPTSSALLTTPQEAANSGKSSQSQSSSPGVGTRSRRNPLIHNLLTDKPVFSPSLPSDLSARTSPATFVKRGMPVTIFPNPQTNPWKPPTASSPSVNLTDPGIDLTRLVHLIDDSFGRKLDVKHYLSRIRNRIAGVIIAGEYEGGAILTWETPPGHDPTDVTRMVPYLDKFAVLKRSQGAGGVADIVFKAMVRDCFPNGVCWRSRKDNPVNKWYFERAKGTWKMPGTNWTMFWTTEEVEQDLFLDYEGVCKAVVPSWADKKAVVD